MKHLVGYAEPLSVFPGDEVTCRLSCDAGPDVVVELVRVVGREESETGGHAVVEPVPSVGSWRVPAQAQEVHTGSFGVVTGIGGHSDSVTYQLNVEVTVDWAQQARLPWLYDYRRTQTQTLISSLTEDGTEGLALVLDADGRPTVLFGDASGPRQVVALAAPLRAETWYAVSGGFDGATGEAFVRATRIGGQPGVFADADHRASTNPPVFSDEVTVSFGARVRRGRGPGGWVPTDAFTGRLEDPEIESAGAVLGRWDFSRDIGTYSIQDVSGRQRHGSLHNLPMRGVCGSRWDGRTPSWPQSPDQFAAIHFFADALEDAAWEPAVRTALPDDLASGFYAFQVTSGEEEDFVPFFVQPRPDRPRARVLFLAPVATYLAYANSRFWWEGYGEELWQNRVVELGPREQTLLEWPELGLSCYDQHCDGNDVAFVSSRHPDLFMRPGFVFRQAYDTDLEIIGWLHRLGVEYDVVTDVDLDREQLALLEHYDVVLAGSHPEYITGRMWDALQSYVDGGGRLFAMGGNNYFWTVAFNEDRPWIMEIRKPETAIGSRKSLAAEKHLAFTGELGGASRHPETLVGVGTASMGWELGGSRPFELTAARDDDRVGFAFEGITEKTIGDHGRIGGAVVFQEWDRADYDQGTPAHALVVGRSAPHSALQRRFGCTKSPNHAEMVFFETQGGGAVFTIGTMAWCASIPDHDYDNDVARLSANVLRRFMDPAPFAIPDSPS